MIREVPPGTYGLSMAHARFDSLNLTAPAATVTLRAKEETVARLAGPSMATLVARDCTAEEQAGGRSVMRGRVRDASTGENVVDAQVKVTWNRLATPATGAVSERNTSTRTDYAGRYALCGLPDGVRLTAQATVDERRSAPVQVVLPDDQINVLDIVVGTPTVGAEAPTKGDAATVRASAPRNQTMRDVERRRRRGNGVYLTRAQIDRTNASRLTDLLRTLPGVSIVPDQSGGLAVELKRSRHYSVDPSAGTRSDTSSSTQTVAAQVSGPVTVKSCPAAFQVDGLPIVGGGSVDIEVRPEMIEMIEVYAGGQVPIEFSARNAECGIVMIWTRAFAGRLDTVPGRDGER